MGGESVSLSGRECDILGGVRFTGDPLRMPTDSVKTP